MSAAQTGAAGRSFMADGGASDADRSAVERIKRTRERCD
jgi:hypothetical protein